MVRGKWSGQYNSESPICLDYVLCPGESIRLWGLFKRRKREIRSLFCSTCQSLSAFFPPLPHPVPLQTHKRRNTYRNTEWLGVAIQNTCDQTSKNKGMQKGPQTEEKKDKGVKRLLRLFRSAFHIKNKDSPSLPFPQVCIPANSGLHSIGLVTERTKTISFA